MLDEGNNNEGDYAVTLEDEHRMSQKGPAPMRDSFDDALSYDQDSKLPELVLEREVTNID